MKPSEQIHSHISGTGTGFELDDLQTRRRGDIYEEIASKIDEIEIRFRNEEYPIGTSNPASFPALSDLAHELERKGL